MKYLRFLLALGAVMAAATGHAQDQMKSMYLEPDINGTVYFQESMSVLNDLEPRPLLDGSGAGQGWMFVQYPGTYVGHVRATDLTAGNKVRGGSKAYLRADANSPVLSVIVESDKARVSRVDNGWATVTFVGEAPAYFREGPNAPASAPPLEIVGDVNTPPAPATPAPRNPAPRPAPAAQSTSGGPAVLPEVVMEDSPTLTPAQPKLRPPSQSVARYLQGRLEPVSVWDRTFGSDYKYRLINQEDETIAYVVLDESLIFGPVEDYWGETVEIQGVMKKITGTVPLEITAGSVRVIR